MRVFVNTVLIMTCCIFT